jgi:uncharacterized protein YozE (UPF0346 family)
MKNHQFYAWMCSQRGHLDGPWADFVEDSIRVSDFPKKVNSWKSLQSYLLGKGAWEPVINVAREVWDEYVKYRQRSTPPT